MPCENIGLCGGCTFRDLSYIEQVKYKENKVKDSLSIFFDADTEFQNIIESPLTFGYRNKMEFSFGDDKRDGPLNLGMHQKSSFYNILNANNCDLISSEMKEVVSKTIFFFRKKNISYYHKKRFTGYLRNLIIRKSFYENKLLLNIVTSAFTSANTNEQVCANVNDKVGMNAQCCKDEAEQTHIIDLDELSLLNEYVEYIKSDYISGILHTTNNQTSDAVKCDNIECLYGEDYITEKVCDIYFKISPFSFFQTNTLCANLLYQKTKEFAISDNNNQDKILYDLFCGTGTITQIMSKYFKKVIGVEIVEEAVEKAKVNAILNEITNVEFILNDVNKFIDDVVNVITKNDIKEPSISQICIPDIIILDPPREGIIEKTLHKILSMKTKRLIYISCKLHSLERDTSIIINAGYKLKKICPVDMFPWTDNVETVALFEL